MRKWIVGSARHRVLAGFMLAVAIGATPAAASSLAPHRAVYEITLDRASAGAGVSELSGRMVFELKGNDCTGYEQTIRFVTRTESAKGEESLMDLRSVYKESAGFGRFQFETLQFQDERLVEETSGDARRNRTTGKLDVRLAKPARKQTSFDAGALFPVEHTKRILEAAREGKRIYASDLYDGSEKGLKVYETTAVIGDRRAPGYNKSLSQAVDANILDDLSSWSVSLSYFGKSKSVADAIPEYELAFLFFENGISRRLFIDYGSFAIRAKLVRLTMLEAAKCRQK
jgi:hypothetical protein